MSPVCVTHDEWHICKSILLCLQYVPPTTCAHERPVKPLGVPPTVSDILARAQHYISSICHPWRVTYMQKHTIKPLVRHAHMSILPWLSICHLWWVAYMQEQTTEPLVYTTHGEWHTCKSVSKSYLLIITSLQNPRLVLVKPRHSSAGFTKPKANTSLVQASPLMSHFHY